MTRSTRKQIFKYIVAHMRRSAGVPPTVEEIRAAAGLASKSTAYYHLERLEQDGLIEMRPVKSRGIRVCGARWVYEEE